MSERVTVEKKEFENFLAENQKLIDRSQTLANAFDRLEKENVQLRQELEATRGKLQRLESNTHPSDASLKKARSDMSRLLAEIDKRIAK
jgi:predicted  nucleic acid-binding Zn-ribbon protein